VWLWHRWRTRGSARPAAAGAPPVRWGWIWFFALIADLSHILLDWTNNYGVRPFFPFNPHWYAGSIFFIFEPVLFGALVLAMVVPAILGLADREIGVRRQRFRGRGWAIFGLSVVILLGCWRWAEHQRALHLLAQQNYRNEAPIRISANPYPGDVFEWFGVVETRDFYQTAIVNTRTDMVVTQGVGNTYYKQPQTATILAAKKSWLGRVFLDCSKYPYVEVSGVFDTLPNGEHYTNVYFEDLRFAYNTLFLHGRENNPLSGTVTIAPDGQVDEMRVHGHLQK